MGTLSFNAIFNVAKKYIHSDKNLAQKGQPWPRKLRNELGQKPAFTMAWRRLSTFTLEEFTTIYKFKTPTHSGTVFLQKCLKNVMRED